MGTVQVKIHKAGWDAAAFALKHSGPEIRKATNKGLRTATKPIHDDLKASILSMDSSAASDSGGAQRRARTALERSRVRDKAARYQAALKAVEKLDRGGFGLRRTIADSIQTKITYGGFSSGIRIRVDGTKLGRAARNLPARIDEGKWRHQVFGNRNAWVTQTGKAGWFTVTVREGAARAAGPLKREIDAAMTKINNGR